MRCYFSFPDYPTCDELSFQCDNKRCVPLKYVCDSDDDCRDNSDERNCPNTCSSSDQFQCTLDSACLPVSMKCNAVWDCFDGSDEENCTGDYGFYVPSVYFFVCFCLFIVKEKISTVKYNL